MKTDLFLFFYSVCKAFLPLPSLEAVLVPLVLVQPSRAFLLALISGVGTFVGGAIGYEIAFRAGRKSILRWISEETLAKGEALFQKHGILAVILGSLTPFPDFILAYLAGLVKMNRFLFLMLDGTCRMIRSLLITASLSAINQFLHLEKYATILSILLLLYFLIRSILKKKRNH